MRDRLNRRLLHKARTAAYELYEQEHAGPSNPEIDMDEAGDGEARGPCRLGDALEALRVATRAGVYENALWLVGGYVRDELLGFDPADLGDADIVTEADSLPLCAALYAQGVTDIAPIVYPRFGTAMLRIGGCDIEVVTARRESYADSSRRPIHVEATTLAEDALRRDFTINTLLENLHTGERLDPTGLGLADIENKLLRTPRNPDETFADDPLRMLRAVRFAAKLGFKIEEQTWDSILRNSALLTAPKVSEERVRDEFSKMLMAARPSHGLELLRRSGLLAQFLPELSETVGVAQNEFHNLPVWDHTLLALDNLVSADASAPLLLRLGILLHDIGKPSTKSVGADGRIHFYKHQDVGAEIAERVLTRLKFSRQDIDKVIRIVALHMRIGEYKPERWTDAAVRRLVRDAGAQLPELFAMHSADVSALAQGHRDLTRAQELRARIDALEKAMPSREISSPLSGEEIAIALGIAPGPQIGYWKRWLTDEVIEGRLGRSDKAAALAALHEQAIKERG